MDSTRRHILDLSRRSLLRGATAAAGLAAIQPAVARRVWANPVFARYPFSLGVASGDPLPDGVVIWTRLAPDPLSGGGMPHQAVDVAWEVAEDPQFRRPVSRGVALARPELGHAVHVEVGGLRPAATYHYRFRAGRETSPVGRTRTAPAADAAPARLRFVNAGCQHYEHGHFTAWRHVAAEPELDFVFHYGDYIYEYRARGNQPGAVVPMRQHQGEEIHTLDDYRNRYALYKLDPDLAAAHAAHPFLVSFDDHEVDNNWAGAISEEDGSARFPVPPEIFALRKQIAFQAWYENMPLRRAALPRGPAIAAHRRLRYGRLADIHVLDTRQYRSDQPCGDVTGPACAEVARPDAQMLGAQQEAWLLGNLADRNAVWQVLAQQVMVMPRDLGDDLRGPRISMDKWDAVPAARVRLLRGIAERGVRNAVVLTGDVHNAWAGTVHADAAEPRGPGLMTEFCATSISSGGDGSEQVAATPTVLRRNPHIAFFNNRRGYCVHEATPERMEVTFRVLPFVSRPDAPLENRARFVVEAGRAEVTRA
ncbi:alkaline phosphatase D family protein [Falsiroseomonas sp.]|uniref:alkaline phosphatase D family protein n=1 Tax=Falsiroseomonas sp. TaxID=2870721 RepID=UPI0035627EAD